MSILFAFAIEFIYRLWKAPVKYPSLSAKAARKKHMLSVLTLIDFIVIIPLLQAAWFAIQTQGLFSPEHFADFVVFRLIRIVSVLQIFKMYRKSQTVILLQLVYKEVKNELAITFLISIQVILMATVLFYHFEEPTNTDVHSIFDALWWAVITLTTVGYGDIVPLTIGGKLLGMGIAFSGIALVTLPTGILTAAFFRAIKTRNDTSGTNIKKTITQEKDGRLIALDDID